MPQPLAPYAAWQDAPTQVIGVVPSRPGVVQWRPGRAEADRMTRIVVAVLAGVFALVSVLTLAAAAEKSVSSSSRSSSSTSTSSTFDQYNRCVRNGYSPDGYVYVECVDEDYVIGYDPAVARAIAPKIVGYLPKRLR